MSTYFRCLGTDIFEYVSWCMHIREYTGLTTTTAKGYPYNYYLIKYSNGKAIKLEFKWAPNNRTNDIFKWRLNLEEF